jgi:hypothetical protein
VPELAEAPGTCTEYRLLAAGRQHRHARPADPNMTRFSGRDVDLLTRVGRDLLASAETHPGFSDARLSLGQSLLDVRDAMQAGLIAVGRIPDRR